MAAFFAYSLELVSGYTLSSPAAAVQSRARSAVMSFDQEAFIAESKEMRLKHLEEQVHTEQPAELRRSPG